MQEIKCFEKKDNELILKHDIAELLIICEKYEKLKSEIIDKIKKEMELNNIIKIETEDVLINYIAESYRETFDSKQLKKDDEALYNKYIKISKVKPSIRIKFRNGNMDNKE